MNYLDGLNERQREAVLHTEGPLLIIAGAGAGKTKTITHRIAYLMSEKNVPAHAILAITFTNKAAGEMRERVRSLVPQGRGMPLTATFHSLGVRILREFYQEAGLPRAFTIWDRDDSMRALKRIAEDLELDTPPRSLLSSISKHKGDGIERVQFSLDARTFRERAVARAWEKYDAALSEEGALDFDDLLLRALKLLRESKSVREKLQARWSHLTIDEYQDTNRCQYEIAKTLAAPQNNICVVGDIDQNIYSWRGADIEHLLQFERTFAGTKVVLLEQNYRSTRTILKAANGIIEKNTRRVPKNLFTDNPTGEAIELFPARSEIDEAWYIASRTEDLLEHGTKPGEIAILYRENFQSRAIEQALLAAGVPYRVLGVRFFERKEVKDLLSYLRAALNPSAQTDITRIIASPPRGIGKQTLEKMLAGREQDLAPAQRGKVAKFRETLEKIKHAAETLPASEAVRYAAEESGLQSALEQSEEGDERMGNLRELSNFAVAFDDVDPPEGILRLLEEAALQGEQDQLQKEEGAVSLMTVHASKGLEFDAVFVTGLEQGLFPSMREGDPAATGRDPEEERRLFYVALTRARKRVFLSFARERLRWGSREFSLPSEFISDIDQRLLSSPRLGSESGEDIIE